MPNRLRLSDFSRRPPGIGSSTVYLEDLEALRGIAISLVLAFHAQMALQPLLPGARLSLPHAFVAAGHTGVGLFFALSGFLLSGPFFREASGGPRVDRAEYLRRRVLRILPLYYAAVAVGTVAQASAPADLLRAWSSLLFLNETPAYSPLLPYSAVWWSLATELQFYLLLPLLPLALRSRRTVAAALLAIAAVYAAFVMGWLPGRRWRFFYTHGIIGRSPLFLCGMAVAWVHGRFGESLTAASRSAAWMRRGGADAILLALLLCLGQLLQEVVFLGYWEAERFWPTWHLLEGALWAAVLASVLFLPLATRALFSNALTRLLGILSYSIYMNHYPILERVAAASRAALLDGGALVGVAVAAAAAAIGLAAVTYAVIERPFLARKIRQRK